MQNSHTALSPPDLRVQFSKVLGKRNPSRRSSIAPATTPLPAPLPLFATSLGEYTRLAQEAEANRLRFVRVAVKPSGERPKSSDVFVRE